MQKPFFSLILTLASNPLGATGDDTQQTTTEEVVITATRFEENKRLAPTLQVIEGDALKSSGTRFLPEILNRQVGVSVRDNTGSPDHQVDIRGFGVTGDQNSVVLIDGQRINENELASANWSSIPLESIDRIEIIRGGASVLYGSGATGGVINIITKKPKPRERNARVSLGLGTYATIDGRAGASLTSDLLGVTLALAHYESDNYRVNNEIEQNSVNLGLDTLSPGARYSTRISAERQNLRLPGARTDTQLITDRRGATTPDDYANRDSWRMGFTAVIPFGENELRTDVSYRDRDTSSLQIGTMVAARSKTYAVSPRVRLPIHLGMIDSALTLGVDWDQWDYRSSRSSSFSRTDLSSTLQNAAFYLQDTYHFPSRTDVTLGGRVQRADYDARDGASPQPYATGSQRRTLRAYEVLIRQWLVESWSVHAKAGESFRIATVDEVYNPFGIPIFVFLEPQTSRDTELGLQAKHQSWQGRLTAYHMDLNHEIHLDPVSFANINYPPTRRYGLELDLHWQAAERLTLSTNATYAKAKFRSGTISGVNITGNDVPLVPPFKANLDLTWTISERLKSSTAITWVDEQYFDNDESNTFAQKIPSFTTVDTRLSSDFGQWTVAGEVRNLFNEKYFTYGVRSLTSARFNAYPAPERSFLITAQYRF